MPTLTFSHTHVYGSLSAGTRSGRGKRAYAWYEIVDPAKGLRSHRQFGILDSGCELSFLDSGLVPTSAGWTLGSPIPMTAAGGSIIYGHEVIGAYLEIEGVRSTGFTPVVGTTGVSLIGSMAYIGSFEIALANRDWLHS